jgi:hypothetical protein
LAEPSMSPADPALPLRLEVESLRGYNSVDVRRYKEYLQLIAGDDRPVRPRQGLFGFPILANFPIENKSLLDLLGTPPIQPASRRVVHSRQRANRAGTRHGAVLEDRDPRARLIIAGGVQELPPFRVWENRTAFRAFVVPEGGRCRNGGTSSR